MEIKKKAKNRTELNTTEFNHSNSKRKLSTAALATDQITGPETLKTPTSSSKKCNSKKLLTRKIIVAMIGLILCGIGIGFLIYAKLGVDPASVFSLGIGLQTGLGYGTVAAIVNFIVLTTVFFINRHYIHIASVLAIFLIGYAAEFTELALAVLIGVGDGQGLNMAWRLIILMVGLLIVGLAIPLYIQAGLGVAAIDLISEIIADYRQWSYRYVRMTADLLFVIAGYLLGGPVGIGTILTAFLLGPIIAMYRPYVIDLTKAYYAK